ncbi:MAG TPA: flavodoxin family protein [Candidatus Limiplasma sp.]|nr:flavodoxin family protein [Candidatus Limiplasma sp.]HPS80659.1 flavodoxin family protein [Candidatus Limiplasma sp.]
MKALMLNGSPHEHGTTRRALDEMASALLENGVETEIMTIGHKPIRGCIACGRCDGRCRAFDDDVNRALEKLESADALVIASPVYFASPNGTLIAFLDRMFSAGNGAVFEGKPAACVTVARRAGTTASLDALYKYPAINGMPIVTSCYWPMAHGSNAGQAEKDEEGMEVLRTLGRNMAWMLRCIEQGKQAGIVYPAAETEHHRTDFIR